MKLICDCDKWKRSADQIIGLQVEQALILIRGEYTGDTWRFCPWCGLVLVAAEPVTPHRLCTFDGECSWRFQSGHCGEDTCVTDYRA